jgi:putative ABC transport system permease protein
MILVALFGIANTQTLPVFERVREIGLLRAVGMDRRQVRSMIRWEAATIAGAGATLGLGLGAFLGWATTRALGQPAGGVPADLLLACAVAAVLAATLATALPARRAAPRRPLITATARPRLGRGVR